MRAAIIAGNTHMRTLACVLFAASFLAQTPRFVPGVWVSTPDGPLELIAFAELRSNGTFVMSSGTLEDVPSIRPHATLRVVTSLANWAPIGVLVSSESIFRERYAERRNLTYAGRKLNVYSHELRVVDLESEESVARLFKLVRASDETPGFAFVIMDSSGIRRYYPVRLTIASQ